MHFGSFNESVMEFRLEDAFDPPLTECLEMIIGQGNCPIRRATVTCSICDAGTSGNGLLGKQASPLSDVKVEDTGLGSPGA